MLPHTNTAKDAALRMVGRTVVNFQRLEHNLKLAARLGPMRGTAPKVQKEIAKRIERASSFTLGQAIRAWLDYCYGPEVECAQTPDLFDVTLEMTFTLVFDDESRERHAKALCDLLEVRNDLIHLRLAKFDWESKQACDDLVVELDQVNVSITEQIEYTGLLLREIAELYKELGESLTAEFTKMLSSAAEVMPNTSLERTREG